MPPGAEPEKLGKNVLNPWERGLPLFEVRGISSRLYEKPRTFERQGPRYLAHHAGVNAGLASEVKERGMRPPACGIHRHPLMAHRLAQRAEADLDDIWQQEQSRRFPRPQFYAMLYSGLPESGGATL